MLTFAQKNSPVFEFRAVWVATVNNIDWPSKKGLTTEEQKAEFIKLADMHQANHINALVVQIRPATDAFYPSPYEPWSEFLTGVQGQAPEPFYDPLAFMIAETHKRGMEFHAWLNPYRAVFKIGESSIAATHLTRTNPSWFLTYGDKKYFNPGLPEVRKHLAKVVKDLLQKYDIDGLHMDDYFYPYRITGKEFPDEKTFQHYGKGMNKEDWRRANCDSIILMLHDIIKANKKKIPFGISPFGVWRNLSQDPNGSNTKAGQTNYDDLYADILLWLRKDWIDYVVPQLYWEQGHPLCDYDTLLNWWNKYSYGKPVFIGHTLMNIRNNGPWKNKNELCQQVTKLRNFSSTKGSVYFSSKSFESNPNGWNDSLKNHYYYLPALIPPMASVDSSKPEKPVISKKNEFVYSIHNKADKKIKAFGLLVLPEKEAMDINKAWLLKIIPAGSTAELNLKDIKTLKTEKLFLVSVSTTNNISEWVEVK